MKTLIGLVLAVIASTACRGAEVMGTTMIAMDPYACTATTLIMPPISQAEILFTTTVQTHFLHVKPCWKQKRIPRASTINKTINGCINHCRRFWPNDLDMPYKFFTAIISESGGNNIGNPDDPSYGICHVAYATAHHACHVMSIDHPSTKRGMILKLAEDVDFNILCSAATMKECESWTNNDWVRTVLIYKCGLSGFSKAVRRLGDKPVTELDIWRDYYRLYLWVTCLKERIIVEGDMITDCGCLPPEDKVRQQTEENKDQLIKIEAK